MLTNTLYSRAAMALLLAAGAALSSCNDKTEVATPERVVGEKFSGDTLRSPLKGTIPGRTAPYYMTKDVTVNDGDTLWIQAGVKIIVIGNPRTPSTFGQATNNPTFFINGVLLSTGTKSQPVDINVADNLKSDPSTVVDVAADPSFKGYWGGINGDGASLIAMKWTNMGYVGGPYGANAPTGYAAGDPKFGISMLARKANARFVLEDSYIHGSVDDCIRLQNANFSVMRNKFEKTGKAGGEAVNVKAGCVGDIAYNVFVGGATNGAKVASVAGSPVQTNVATYNNTFANCGYRQTKSGRGGSINYEVQAKGLIYNNLIVNCRFGLRLRSDDRPDTANVRYGNQYYYANTTDQAAELNAATAGSLTRSKSTDTRGAAQANSPRFQSFDLTTASGTTAAPTTTIQWTNFLKPADNLHLQAGSPALGKGYTSFQPLNAVSSVNVPGIFTPTSTAPGVDAGAYQANGSGNQY
ncbi:hypothetical protein [Hymenobacter negativus]|uniref:Right-handed parallel beta-helix repeat-containing protein n=1 Tax=Hymenobacter negativus TaxID=2795026 RepID=A0ABS3QKV3_9BACT|nr:hypothetical protein [Hymenobacter negativus]MBO2011603.1 hypothetical protein [Hymenobacter negativus]